MCEVTQKPKWPLSGNFIKLSGVIMYSNLGRRGIDLLLGEEFCPILPAAPCVRCVFSSESATSLRRSFDGSGAPSQACRRLADEHAVATKQFRSGRLPVGCSFALDSEGFRMDTVYKVEISCVTKQLRWVRLSAGMLLRIVIIRVSHGRCVRSKACVT